MPARMTFFAATIAATTLMAQPLFAQEEDVLEFSLILELNETDNDAEVVLEINSDESIQRVVLLDPSFRCILNLRSKDRERLGLSEILIETAEPSVQEVLDAYPEGQYILWARTDTGWHYAMAEPSHDLLLTPDFTPDDEVVDPNDAFVEWAAVAGAEKYIIEIEQGDLGINFTTTVPENITIFTLPAELLVADTEYEIGVTVAADNGNLTVVESSFQTLP